MADSIPDTRCVCGYALRDHATWGKRVSLIAGEKHSRCNGFEAAAAQPSTGPHVAQRSIVSEGVEAISIAVKKPSAHQSTTSGR